MSSTISDELDLLFREQDSVIARDLKVNLKRSLQSGALAPEEAHFALLAAASALDLRPFAAYAVEALARFGVPAEQIREAAESAAIMGMLNVYYRFKHMTEHGEDYRSAGLRMTVFSNPALGKTRFEMLAFAVSVLNGCESCIRSHERVLREAGASVDKIHELVRIAAIVKGVDALRARS